jgi:hypothetical protein
MPTDPRTLARDLPAFEAFLREVPWLGNLGRPHAREAQAARIHDWDEWHGPEGGYGDWFGRYPPVVREQLEAQYPERATELAEVWDRIERVVIKVAGSGVPGFGEGDAHNGPTSCVYQAGYTAALVACHVRLERPIPDPIVEEWMWFTEGHWPCDYAEEPPGCWDESRVDVPAGKLQVY